MMLVESDIGQDPLGCLEPWFRERLFLGHFDRDFRAIGLGQPCLVFLSRGHRAVADFMGVAEFVEIEQVGCERFATRMSLTLVLIDVYSEFSGHDKRSSWSRS
jgi:hypothetical protein